MLTIKNKHCFLSGPAGKFKIPQDDEITLKLAMIYEGECTDLGPLAAARKFGYSKPRYFQLRHLLAQCGAAALQSRPRGPKSNYRRTEEIVRQIIRHPVGGHPLLMADCEHFNRQLIEQVRRDTPL